MPEKQLFSHVHGHGSYSLRDGLGKVEETVETAAKLGFESICLTDHGTAGGWFDLDQSTKKFGIKPLFGVELYVADDRTWHGITGAEEAEFKAKHGKEMTADERKVFTKEKGRSFHLVVHAVDAIGVQHLSEIVTDSNVNGFYKVPRTDWATLKRLSEGLFASTACLGGVLSVPLIKKTGDQLDPDEAMFERNIAHMKDIFKDKFVLELQANDMEAQKIVNKRLYEEAKKRGIPFILTQDFHYPKAEDFAAHGYVKMMDFGISAKDWKPFSKHVYNLCTYEELWGYWCKNGHNDILGGQVFAEACANTKIIEKMLNPKADYTSQKIPKFPVPVGFKTSEEYFIHLVNEGWKWRYYQMGHGPYKHTHEQYWAQVCKEVEVIKKMGFIDYFLIVADFCMHAKRSGWAVGPARGSAGGCMVSWLLGITEIDPLRFRLVFERFLNPERKKMPDIDSDFSDEDRHKVKDYLTAKWGAENCASIVAYNRYSAKSVLSDIARLHDIAPSKVFPITKQMESDESLEDAMKSKPDITAFINENNFSNLIPVVKRLEGQIRHLTQAAAGVLISDRPIGQLTTLRRQGGGDDDSTITTEIEGDKLGEAGFLKMDVLGVRELRVLQVCCKKLGKDLNWLYQEVGGSELDDEKVWDKFKAGDTLAVFQFASDGMKQLLRNVKPAGMMELAAVSALYRPQTLQSGVAEAYWKRKHGQEPIKMIHPLVDHLFKDTYGLQVFQEQFIAAFKELGLSYGEADILRRTYEDVVKPHKRAKAQEKIDQYMDKIKKGGKLPPDELDRVATILGGEVGYSFNVAHSVAYSLIAYFGQWMKVHHPEMFWVAVMNTEMGHNKSGEPVQIDPFIARLDSHFREIGKTLGIVIGNINSFTKEFMLINDQNGQPWLYYPVTAIKGIGDKTVDALYEYVASHGKPFTSIKEFFEFKSGSFGRAITSAHIKILIELGFFENLPLSEKYPYALNRLQLLDWFEVWHEIKGSATKRELMYANQPVITKDKEVVPVSNKSTTADDIRASEVQYLGTIITGNTVRKFAREIMHIRSQFEAHQQDRTVVGGMLADVKQDAKRADKLLVYVDTVDEGRVEITVWQNEWRNKPLQLQVGNVYIFVCARKGKWLSMKEVRPLSVEKQNAS
jgi:DNA polymerase-3 subunit alpha